MDDQVLIHILETACSEENLVFQVVEQDRHLHVFLNREPGQVLDYKIIGKKIYQALTRLSLTDVDGVCLYSRVLGEEEPDWEAKFRLPQAQQESEAKQDKAAQSETQRQMSEAATYVMEDVAAQRIEAKKSMVMAGGDAPTVATRSTATATPAAEAANYPLSDKDGVTEAAAAYEAAEAAAPTVSVVAAPHSVKEANAAIAPLDEDFELSEHCFIRNRMLLTADILPPSKAVAKQINSFHEFSMAEKQRMMPQLELFFKGAPTFSPEGLTEAQQEWFQEMEALTGDDTRKGPIWLSRYCVDAEATLEVVARVFDPSLGAAEQEEELAEESTVETGSQGGAAHSISGSMTGGMSAAPRSRPNSQARSSGPGSGQATASKYQPNSAYATAAKPQPKSPFPPGFFPGIVVFGSMMMILMGLVFAKPATLATSNLCNSSAHPELCQLATQIVESEALEEISGEAVPIPTDQWAIDSIMQQATASCSPLAAMNAGENFIKAFEDTPTPLKSSAAEVMPGIILADVEQANIDAPGTGNVRTACVLQYDAFEGIPGVEAAPRPIDNMVIPTAWPAESFESGEGYAGQMRQARAQNPLVRVGANLIFTAIGMFAAVMMRTAITAYSVDVLCQATIVMCIIESIMDFIVPFGVFSTFAGKSLSLGLTSWIVPNFKLDWSNGYISVLACVMVMSFIRLLLGWIFFVSILQGGAMSF